MDLDTFLTTLYVIVDDWYTIEGHHVMKRHAGGRRQMTDSEVLTIALAGQWQVGVPWRSERGLVRYMQAHGRQWFPHMLQRSAFNERVRHLWGAFIALHQSLVSLLDRPQAAYECVDCQPLPACSLAQAASHDGHWLWWSHLGRGGNQGGWYWGEQLLASVTAQGIVTGWVIAPAQVDDRWVMDAFVQARCGLVSNGPPPNAHHETTRTPPVGHIGPRLAVGFQSQRPYVLDQGFNGERWRYFWQATYGIEAITVPPANAPEAWAVSWKQWLAHHRQIVETVFARLDSVFALKHLNAHSRWGQYTRVAAKVAAYTIGIYLNRLLGRLDGALETLLC